MYSMLKKLIFAIIIAVLVGGGVYYLTIWKQPIPEENNLPNGDSFRAEGYSGRVLAGKSSPLLDFNKSDYDTALKSGKPILLYFYANWCPLCVAETKDALYPAFNEISHDKIIGFRVNYKDNQTDDDEKNLAREFGVAYQHTKVILKNGQRGLKAPDSWDKNRYLNEINKALSQ